MNTNPFTEIGAIVVAVVLATAGGLLLYAGKIDAAFASSMFILAAGLLGVTGALKVPSSSQQTQINTLLQGLQDLINLFASHTHPVQPTPPSTPTQPVQPLAPGALATTTTVQPQVQFIPDPATSMAAYSTSQMPAIQPQGQQ